MQTFSCACQTVNIDDHIVARFDAGSMENPDDTSVCRMTVWHEGGEATITTFNRNGMVINSVMIPPPSQQEAAGAPTTASHAADTSASSGKGSTKK
jgi:hypothetical protein